MNYLLDTDVIINQLRGKKELDPQLARESLSISIITYGELLYGAEKSLKKERALALINEFISEFSIKIIYLNEKIMKLYARIKAELDTKGKRIDDFDLLIASSALSESLALVTENTKHFQRIPKLEIK